MAGVPMTATIQGLSCEIVPLRLDPRHRAAEGRRRDGDELLAARREGLPWGDARVAVEARMMAAPRRIGELVLVFDRPREVRPADRARLEEIARTCPVARSLHPDVKVPAQFRWP